MLAEPSAMLAATPCSGNATVSPAGRPIAMAPRSTLGSAPDTSRT
jgi:hypothetical protein